MSFDMKQFVKERDEALKSLDKQKIIAYSKKYGVPTPDNDRVFWAGIHKARLGIKDITLEEQVQSAKWLLENGFKVPDYAEIEVLLELLKNGKIEESK